MIVGPVTKSVSGCVNQSLGCSVFASSATIALALPSPVALPAPTAATSVPSWVNATAPTTSPPFDFHDTTGFASLSRSIAHTALGAPPQPPEVEVYIVVPTATGADQRELAGTNSAGFCMSFPEGRPTTWSMPSLDMT